jgi:hypothetical protein
MVIYFKREPKINPFDSSKGQYQKGDIFTLQLRGHIDFA